MNLHFQTFRLQPPHAPLASGHTSCSGQAWPPIRLAGLSAVLRTSFIDSSLVSRIRPNRVCVAVPRAPLFYGLSVHFQLLSTPYRYGAVTFSYPEGSSPGEGLSPPVHVHSQAHYRRSPDLLGGEVRGATEFTPARLGTSVPTGKSARVRLRVNVHRG